VLKLKAKTEDIIKIVDLMAEVIIENEVYFCDLDGVAGDGDFGMSFSKGFRQIKAEWN
jgi:dihydroxyacetone kinase